VAIIRYRRMLRRMMDALEQGDRTALPMHGDGAARIVGPLSNDAIAETADWQAVSRAADLARRAACPWDATV